jgi:hypothetical protein
VGAPAAVPAVVPAMTVVAQGSAAPVVLSTGAPAVTTVSKGSATPALGLPRALTPATMNGGLTGGWGRVMAVGPPAVVMTPTTRSREVAAAA